MQSNVFEELKTTVHFVNRSGVRATCPDCHVPHSWTDKLARKMQASNPSSTVRALRSGVSH
jgi:cytochrome c-type protein NapC